ncbi:acyltransferase family protein [Sphingomonas sp. DT-51]|uniref:acyltransferase family protein n=1 Tax=Sphingomonas sp. DT-51 TaxID=3396165 RepID=UPI003F1A7548
MRSASVVGKGARGEHVVAAHGLRGLASAMVVFAHIIGGPARHVYADNATYVALTRAPWHLATFGVMLFFVISGFVILPSALRYAPGEFALRRGLRLYPLFAVLSVLFVALNAVTNAYPKINTPLAVVAGFTFTNLFTGTDQLTPNAWSLSYEVMFYALTCAVVTLAVKRRDRLTGTLAVAAALAFVLAFPIALYFVAGVAIRLLRWRYPDGSRATRWVELLAFAGMTALASHAHYEYWWRDFRDPVVVPLILLTATYFYCAVAPESWTERLLGNRVFAYLGTISYSLYLVHPYIYLALRKLFVRHGLFTDDWLLSMLPFALLVAGGSLVASHVVHLWLERWPYERFFRQRIYRADRIARGDPATDATMTAQRA